MHGPAVYHGCRWRWMSPLSTPRFCTGDPADGHTYHGDKTMHWGEDAAGARKGRRR